MPRLPGCGGYAAAELQVSPGAVSRHVRLLERFLGTELFVRQSNGVTLTPAGNRYARKVSRIVRDLRRATAEVRTAEVRTPDPTVGPRSGHP